MLEDALRRVMAEADGLDQLCAWRLVEAAAEDLGVNPYAALAAIARCWAWDTLKRQVQADRVARSN